MKTRLFAIVMIVATLFVAVFSMAKASTTPSGPAGKIIFGVVGFPNAFVRTVDTSDPMHTVQRVFKTSAYWYSAVSPDRSSFVIEVANRNQDGNFPIEFWVYDSANPATPKEVVPYPDDPNIWISGITWTDQPYIFAQNWDRDHATISTYVIKNSVLVPAKTVELGNIDYVNGATADLHFILFTRWNKGNEEFVWYDSNTKTEKLIDLPSKNTLDLDVSPDNRYITAVELDQDWTKQCLELYNTETDVKSVLDCVPFGWSISGVTWSPDGKYGAIISSHQKENQLLILDLQNPEHLVPEVDLGTTWPIHHITWSPDSRYIAYYSDYPKAPGIYVMDILVNETKILDFRETDGYPFEILGWIK